MSITTEQSRVLAGLTLAVNLIGFNLLLRFIIRHLSTLV